MLQKYNRKYIHNMPKLVFPYKKPICSSPKPVSEESVQQVDQQTLVLQEEEVVETITNTSEQEE